MTVQEALYLDIAATPGLSIRECDLLHSRILATLGLPEDDD